MKHNQCIAKIAPVDMGIDLSGHDRLMPEHFLYGPQVGTGFDHVCRKRVPEGMRTDLFHYTCFTGKIPDDREYHCSGEFSSPAVQKHYIFVIDYRKPLSVNLIKINLLKGLFADRHKPLLIALALHSMPSALCPLLHKPCAALLD